MYIKIKWLFSCPPSSLVSTYSTMYSCFHWFTVALYLTKQPVVNKYISYCPLNKLAGGLVMLWQCDCQYLEKGMVKLPVAEVWSDADPAESSSRKNLLALAGPAAGSARYRGSGVTSLSSSSTTCEQRERARYWVWNTCTALQRHPEVLSTSVTETELFFLIVFLFVLFFNYYVSVFLLTELLWLIVLTFLKPK